MKVEHDVPLRELTTLRLGGAARRMAVCERESDVPEALDLADREGAEPFVVGGGSNLVVADEGVDAFLVRVATRGVTTSVGDGYAEVTAEAGEAWDPFVASVVEQGLSGLECLAGIPGLVGATPIQNVGAYGQEVSDTVKAVRGFDRVARRFVELSPGDCAFGYRTSRLKTTGRYVVTAVTFRLPVQAASAPVRYAELARALDIPEGASAPLERVREAVVALRRGKGMVLDPADAESVSAGSFFVNPVLDEAGLARVVAAAAGLEVPRHRAGEGRWKVPAAWLIERAGFTRGYGPGPVRISHRHALALVNAGGTTRELLALAREIVAGVEQRFGVLLTPEPVMLGCRL